MFFSEKEKEIMTPLLRIIRRNYESIYEITLQDGTIILATFDTSYETDNRLDEEDEKYEEFYACLFKIKEILYVKKEFVESYHINDFIEITYNNYPKALKII